MTLLEQLRNDVQTAISQKNDTAPLLKRVFLFLEDGEFTQAATYSEKVLDSEPENAMAYLGKLMADKRMQTLEELVNHKEVIHDVTAFRRAVRFADETAKQHLQALDMQVYGNCIAAARRRANYLQKENELKEAAQYYQNAMSLWEECEGNIPDGQAIYAELKNEVADFNWFLLLHNRQCADEKQLIASGIPINTDRWYESAQKWADDEKRAHYEQVAKETLFCTHLKCIDSAKAGNGKLSRIWLNHYKASAPQGDPLLPILEAVVATDGFTRFCADAPVALLKLVQVYTSAYPQGVEPAKALLQNYYERIFQSCLQFAGEAPEKNPNTLINAAAYAEELAQREQAAASNTEWKPEESAEAAPDYTPAEAMRAARDVTRQLAQAIPSGYCPYGLVSLYLVAAKYLTVRYGRQDCLGASEELFAFVCEYYEDAISNSQPEQAKAIRDKFNDFLMETCRLKGATANVACAASSHMEGSHIPYQIFLSRLTNDYSVEKEELISPESAESFANWCQLITDIHPRKECYWICDHQDEIFGIFENIAEIITTCRQYAPALKSKVYDAYQTILQHAGEGQVELSNSWEERMGALEARCNKWADQLEVSLTQTQEIYSTKLLKAKRQVKLNKWMQFTAVLLRGVALLATALALMAMLVPLVGFAWNALQDPYATAGFNPVVYYAATIGVPLFVMVLSLIHCSTYTSYHTRKLQAYSGLIMLANALSYVALGGLVIEAIYDSGISMMLQNLGYATLIALGLLSCGIARTAVEFSCCRLVNRSLSRATDIALKVIQVIARAIYLAQTLVSFAIAVAFICLAVMKG